MRMCPAARPASARHWSGARWLQPIAASVATKVAAQRRARVFEAILPYRISANLKRFQSPYLMQDYRRMLAMETSIVEAQLPARVAQDPVAAAALNVILSFQTWRLLRHDQAMPVETAQAVVKHLLDNTLAKIPD
jgi:hypothetical protein